MTNRQMKATDIKQFPDDNRHHIDSIKEEIAELGATITGNDLRLLEETRHNAKQIAIDTENEDIHSDKSWFDNLEAQAPKVGNAMQQVGNASSVVIRAFFTSIGTIIILIGLLVVEIIRVKFGVQYFEHTEFLAFVGATVLVMLNMLGEFFVHYIETKYGYSENNSNKFSIRLWLRSVKYFIGFSDDFEARQHSPAKTIKDFNKVLTYGILFIALIGSMRAVISVTSGVWYEALYEIVLHSDLETLSTWISGFIFTFLTVRGAQIITSIVAKQADEVISNGFGKSGHDLYVSAMDYAELKFWEMKLLNTKSKINKKANTPNA